MLIIVAALVGAVGAGGMAQPAAAQPATGQPRAQWRVEATDNDRLRLRQWRRTWTQALREARSGGHQRAIAAEGALLMPDAALDRVRPPEGEYRCRTIKIGDQGRGGLSYNAYPAFRCRIAERDGVLTFVKLSGSQRPIGRLYGDHERRMIFLGTLQLGDERRALRYGSDRERDMAAILERVGDRRWRLVFPRPHFESTLDVIELVPAG